ncbi:MAG: PRC-barrel domain-containing protein [archaeon]
MITKKTKVLSTKITPQSSLIGARSYLGRKVFSKSGYKIGRVKDVALKNDHLVGFLVKGKKKVFVDKEYVASESENAIVLSTDPVINLIGKIVFDSQGTKVGKVIDLDRQTNANNFKALIVKKKPYSKPMLIPKDDVDIFKENIILNKIFEKK